MSIRPNSVLEPDLRRPNRQATGHRAVGFAIDGKDETAWGIDVGPGRRNVPRNAVFVLEKPVCVPGRQSSSTFKLVQKHGGWNSDDNQNNNLGRFRFSITDRADAEADPVPRRGPRNPRDPPSSGGRRPR